MGLSFSVKLAPGIRVRASSRGLRTSIGPRAARMHVGGGRTGFSTGAGPVTLYSSAGGSRGRTGGRRPSAGSYQRQLAVSPAAAAKADEAQRLAKLFQELLSAQPPTGSDDDRAFALKLAFCRHLEPPARLELLQRRRNQVAEKLARGRQALAAFARASRGPHPPGDTPVPPDPDRYTRALIEHETTTAERDLEWVDSLIAAERGEELQGRTT